MSFQNKLSSITRPLFCSLTFSYGKSANIFTIGLKLSHLSKLGHRGVYSLQTRIPKIQNANILFRAAHIVTKSQTRAFHTSGRRYIPPLLWVFLKPLAKFSAAMTGRGVRQWFRNLDPAKRQKIWAAIKRHWYIPAGLSVAATGSTVVYYISHIEETPVTGRKRFVALTHDQVVKIAEAEAQQLIENFKGKLYTVDEPQAKRVIQVAHSLLTANKELRKMQFKEWQIYVIKDPLVNACVLPSGHMFVFDGILQLANTQDQLAIILGHEMAHAVLEHGTEMPDTSTKLGFHYLAYVIEELSLAGFVDVFVIFCLAAIWCIIPFDGIALITHWFYNKVIQLLTHMPHSRKMEKEADKVGLMFAARACYDIRQGSILWTKMSHHEKLNDQTTNILPEWMLTHPESLKRAHHLDFLQTTAEKWREEMQCPKLPTQDPREAVKVLSQHVENLTIAKKSGQDLRRVQQQPPLITVKNT